MKLFKKVRNLFSTDLPDEGSLLSSLLDHITDLVAVTDLDGKIRCLSNSIKVASKDAGLSTIPDYFTDIIDESNRYDYMKLLEYVARENKPAIDFRVSTLFASVETESFLSIVPTSSSLNSTSSLLHILRSAKGNKTDTPDLKQIEKLTNVGKIAAGMAHELNTPLGSIVLSAEHIIDAVENHDLVQEASRIKSRAAYCSKVVQELLGYVRHDVQIPKRYCLINIVNKVVDILSSEVKRRSIELSVIETDGDAFLECNENQIEQLLFNLIDNASHAIDSKGRIDISFRRDQLLNRIYITIKDSGTGIAPENIKKIFDPFFTTKPGAQGTGLGLALCKKIVLEHGGDITVNSKVGHGTTFEVWMPLENE